MQNCAVLLISGEKALLKGRTSGFSVHFQCTPFKGCIYECQMTEVSYGQYLPIAQNYSWDSFHFYGSKRFSALESRNGYNLQVSVIGFLKDSSSDTYFCHLENQNCFFFSIRLAEKWCGNWRTIEMQAPRKVVLLFNQLRDLFRECKVVWCFSYLAVDACILELQS